jgi:hypothetical protein
MDQQWGSVSPNIGSIEVALKVLLEVADNEDRVQSLHTGSESLALNHPTFSPFEIGNFENSRFIATELVKGHTLHERLRGGPLTHAKH